MALLKHSDEMAQWSNDRVWVQSNTILYQSTLTSVIASHGMTSNLSPDPTDPPPLYVFSVPFKKYTITMDPRPTLNSTVWNPHD